jgi:hypothetical protein
MAREGTTRISETAFARPCHKTDLVAALPDDLCRSHPRGEGPDFAKELVRLVAVGERPH